MPHADSTGLAARGVVLAVVLAVALAAALGLALNTAAAAHPMVLSIDDGPSLAPTPRLSPEQRHQALRETLARQRVHAVLYVTLAFGADRPAGLALARAWGEAGHLLGNHTVSHLDLHDPAVSVQRYADEIAQCDAAMHAVPGWRRWFRATYLHEGDSDAKREWLRRTLAAQGYRLAPVHLDSLDWQVAPRLAALLLDPRADPQLDGAALKRDFIAGLLERAGSLRHAAMAAALPGQALPPLVLLMHDNLLTALWLDEVLQALRDQGFVFVPPEAAMALGDAAAGAAVPGPPVQ